MDFSKNCANVTFARNVVCIVNPIPTSTGLNQPIYSYHVTQAGRNRVKPRQGSKDTYRFHKNIFLIEGSFGSSSLLVLYPKQYWFCTVLISGSILTVLSLVCLCFKILSLVIFFHIAWSTPSVLVKNMLQTWSKSFFEENSISVAQCTTAFVLSLEGSAWRTEQRTSRRGRGLWKKEGEGPKFHIDLSSSDSFHITKLTACTVVPLSYATPS